MNETQFVTPVLAPLQAQKALSKRGLFRAVYPPDRCELCYVPGYLYEADPDFKFVLDALQAQFAWYAPLSAQAALPAHAILLGSLLDAREALNRGKSHFERICYQNNLRQPGARPPGKIGYAGRLNYPYWLGYRETDKRIEINVVDAVTGSSCGPGQRATVLTGLQVAESS